MTHVSSTPQVPSPPLSSGRHGWTYLIMGLAVNAVLWGAAILYARTVEPEYVSEWALTLPSAGTTTSVNLPDIGDASAQVQSPYNNANTRDPRENYRFIVTSEPVLSKAADSLGMSTTDFGRPRVQIIDNTTLIAFEMEGESPELAQQKSIALFEALQATLRQLRAQEVAQRNQGVESTLAEAQAKLEEAQQRLSAYKASSGLTSNLQLDQLSTNIEELRRDRAMLLAQQRQADARLQQYSVNLNVSARQAAEAFTLSADPVFQQTLTDYSAASAMISSLRDQLGPNHPVMVRETTRQRAAEAALLERGRSLLQRPVNLTTLAQLNVGNAGSDSGREQLFQDTVTAQVDQQGLTAQVVALDQQIAALEARLQQLAQRGSTLEALNRDVTIAEAVFSATLTRLDLGKADLFGSYPQVQLVTEPSLPEGNKPLKAKLALLGALFGSFLVTAGLITLWIRDHKAARRQPAPLGPMVYPPEVLNGAKPGPTVHSDTDLVSHPTSPDN